MSAEEPTQQSEISAEEKREVTKSPDAFRTISEVAVELNLPQHVLRFWETRFPQIKPLKRGGSRRYYRPQDIETLRRIRQLLYDQGYTIKGVQRLLKEPGARAALREVGQARPLSPLAETEVTQASEILEPAIPLISEVSSSKNAVKLNSGQLELGEQKDDRHKKLLSDLLIDLRQVQSLLKR